MRPAKAFPVYFLSAILIGCGSPVWAHTQSTAFLTLRARQQNLAGEWHLALRDLEDAVGLDANDDGLITWGELRARREAVLAYAVARLRIRGDGLPGNLAVHDLLVETHSDGTYAVLRFDVNGLSCPRLLEINYQALFDIDQKHRGLLRLETAGSTRLAVFGPDTAQQVFDLGGGTTQIPFESFVNEGIWHIWHGYDHLLFLLALLLPGVLRRRNGQWEPAGSARVAAANLLKMVTGFTVAHSITLTVAALGLVHLPTRLIESAIAASVIVAALNNLVPFFPERGWTVAFGFGLLHGFGFANALGDLGLRNGQLALTLLGFNVGVELGQLAILLLFLPLALGLRRLLIYPKWVLRFGSVIIVVISTGWLAERVFEFKWLPF